MLPAALSATPRELPALIEQITATLPPDEAAALSEAARTYAGKGAILEITAGPGDAADAYAAAVREWRAPLRLLLITGSDSAAAERAYDDWSHWVAGGGLLALRAADELYRRAEATGKFRTLAATGTLRILQRIAACN
ncbi:hypothetical protein ABZ412_02880 [Nocardia sp. NPDC005746]|uniref:hypothetical protein n=1 Tax=Nocardia sp. NPDC005746 TaxID=3157062 RepID=UPI0033CC02E5